MVDFSAVLTDVSPQLIPRDEANKNFFSSSYISNRTMSPKGTIESVYTKPRTAGQ